MKSAPAAECAPMPTQEISETIESPALQDVVLAKLGGLNFDAALPTRVQKEKLILSEGEFRIKDTDFTMLDSIELSGNAKLIIEDSVLRHLATHSGGVGLVAKGDSMVIIRNSIIESDNANLEQRRVNAAQNIPHFNNWTFEEGACLNLENVRTVGHGIWHGFTWNASGMALIKDSDFGGTFNGEGTVHAFIDNGVDENGVPFNTFVEVVEPAGSKDVLLLPQSGNTHLHVGKAELHVSGTEMKWGLTINPNSDVTVQGENYTPLTVTMVLGGNVPGLQGKTVEICDLHAGQEHRADDLRLNVPEFGIALQLKNVQPKDWSPIVMGNNDVTFLRGDFADNMWSSQGATVTYMDANLSQVQIKDLEDPAKSIRLVNCNVANVVANAGQIDVEGGVIKGMAVGDGAGKVVLRGTDILENSISGNVERR